MLHDVFLNICNVIILAYDKFLFSKLVLDIRMRLVVTKWMPNSDSALKLMPKCKILGQLDLPNYFYSCLKIAVF